MSRLSREPLFHSILKQARDRSLRQPLLVGVSGGLDSVVLLRIIDQVAKVLSLPVAVASVHHGPSPVPEQAAFRDSALQFVRSLSEEIERPFFSLQSELVLNSEAELRTFRFEALKKIEEEWGHSSSRWVFAHHADDLLETRLIQLIRGGGASALFAQAEFGEKIWRPLNLVSRRELRELAERQDWSWREDPSNQKVDALRNWLRIDWLPQLEKKREGSLLSLARSLDQLAETFDRRLPNQNQNPFKNKLSIADWPELDVRTKRDRVWDFLRNLQLLSYTQHHINEIIKRADSSQKASFVLLDRTWSWEPGFLRVHEPSQSDKPQ